MPYPDIKEPRISLGLAIVAALYLPEVIIAPIFVVWGVVYFGFGVKELWLSFLVTAMIFAAIACFVFYFYAESIERAAARRKARFRKP